MNSEFLRSVPHCFDLRSMLFIRDTRPARRSNGTFSPSA
jgi:hypothetical protein